MSSQEPAPPSLGGWETLPSMPGPPRVFVGVAAVADRVFVVGGIGAGAAGQAVHAFDPTTESWETLAPLPQAFAMPNVAAVGGKLYVLGARGVPDVLEYDVAGTAWRARKPIPFEKGRGAAAVGVHGGKILVAGGITPGQSANMLNTGVREREFLAYDPATDEWEMLPDLPLARGYAMGAVVGDKFWVIGGSSDFVRTDQVDVFDFSKGEWSVANPTEWTLSSAAVAVLANRIYVIGGIATSTGMITPETLALDPSTQVWTKVSPMTTPRFGTGAAVLGGRIYVPAGAAQSGMNAFDSVGTLERFVP